MKVWKEIGIEKFEAWSGATDTLKKIIDAGKAAEATAWFEEIYPEGISEGKLNDILWFDADTLFEDLGIPVEE